METQEFQTYAVRDEKLVHAAPRTFRGAPDEIQCLRHELLWRLWRHWYNKLHHRKEDETLYATHYDVVELGTGRHVGRFSVECAQR